MHKHGPEPQPEKALPEGVRHIVAVGAGKGGVGKSTVAVNLAVAMAAEGLRAGLLDADVYGPNLPQMMGVQNHVPRLGDDGKIEPAEAHGVRLMSMGFLLEPDSPVIWRGPLLHGAMNQFLRDVRWGGLDVLVVDLPPGTGDVQLSIAQTVPLAGAVIVTTPQSIALCDVLKAAAMFRKLEVPIFGVVENMGDFVCPHCRQSSRVFSHGAARKFAEKYGVPLQEHHPLAVCHVRSPLSASRPTRMGESQPPLTSSRPPAASRRDPAAPARPPLPRR